MDGLAIAASITEAKGAILGGVIRTIYQPEFGTFVLHLFAGGDRRFLLSPGRAALHLTNLDLAIHRDRRRSRCYYANTCAGGGSLVSSNRGGTGSST